MSRIYIDGPELPLGEGRIGPCGDPNDYQNQVNARPELRGNPPTITVAEICRLYGLKRREVLKVIQRGEVDVVMKEADVVVTIESALVRFGHT